MNKEQIEAKIKTWEGVNPILEKKYRTMLKGLKLVKKESKLKKVEKPKKSKK